MKTIEGMTEENGSVFYEHNGEKIDLTAIGDECGLMHMTKAINMLTEKTGMDRKLATKLMGREYSITPPNRIRNEIKDLFCKLSEEELAEVIKNGAQQNDYIVKVQGKIVNISEMVRNNESVQKKTDNPAMDKVTASIKVNQQLCDMFGLKRPQARKILESYFEYEKLNNPQPEDTKVAKCPKCGSTSLSADKKGFGIGKAVVGAAVAGPIGLIAGNIGAKKVRVTCLNCGNQFWAGK